MVWVRAPNPGAGSHGVETAWPLPINPLGTTVALEYLLRYLAHNVKSIARAARGVKKNRPEKCYSLVTTSPVLAVRPRSPRALLFALQAAWIFLASLTEK
jgi:hypothetical protein